MTREARLMSGIILTRMGRFFLAMRLGSRVRRHVTKSEQ
jgi:hypothetical protein